jgi:hypothetical protein
MRVAGKAVTALYLIPTDGQKVFGRIVAEQLARTLVELGPDVIRQPTKSAR